MVDVGERHALGWGDAERGDAPASSRPSRVPDEFVAIGPAGGLGARRKYPIYSSFDRIRARRPLAGAMDHLGPQRRPGSGDGRCRREGDRHGERRLDDRRRPGAVTVSGPALRSTEYSQPRKQFANLSHSRLGDFRAGDSQRSETVQRLKVLQTFVTDFRVAQVQPPKFLECLQIHQLANHRLVLRYSSQAIQAGAVPRGKPELCCRPAYVRGR